MTTFFEASQARLILKMKLVNHHWYKSSRVIMESDGFAVLIGVTKLDNDVRKIIPIIHNGVVVKTTIEN